MYNVISFLEKEQSGNLTEIAGKLLDFFFNLRLSHFFLCSSGLRVDAWEDN